MISTKRLGYLLILLITGVLIAAGLDYFGDFDWQQLVGRGSKITSQTTVKVVSEESAVISVVEETSPSVVSVVEKSVVFDFFTGPRVSESSIGTGFAVGEDLIVTNKHVVSNKSAEYTVVDNQEKKYIVLQVYRDPVNDLALLKIENGSFSPLDLGDSNNIKVGQTAVAIGNALGRFSNTVTKGVVSGIGRGITAAAGFGRSEVLDDVIQTDAALNPGNSGGPLLNLEAQVIGVNVAVGQGSENIGFAIPVNRLKDLIANFNENKKISRPYLGISYVLISGDLANERGLPEGAFVREVIPGSAAAEAGIQPNDIITAINSESVSASQPLSKLILKHKVGEEISLKVWRNSKAVDVKAVLKEAEEE